MRGAPELKLILALADAQLGAAGLVGAGVKRAEPDFDAAERRRGVSLRDFDGQLVLGLGGDRDAEPRRRASCPGAGMNRTAYSATCPVAGAGTSSAVQYSASVPANGASPSVAGCHHGSGGVADLDTAPASAWPDADFAPTLIENISPATTGIGTSHTARLIGFADLGHDAPPHEFRCAAWRPAMRPNTRQRPSPCWAKPPCDSPAQ